ncbi:MAG: hypothetical protein JWQ23_2403 [Herminiimonas sp.]|nr:hypothetical protein [Herminiimonas sp.]
MDDSNRESQTRQIIANAERLINEANEALAAADRFFFERHINREQLLKQLQQHSTNGAPLDIKAELEKTMQEVRAASERKIQHMQFDQPSARRPKRVRNLV